MILRRTASDERTLATVDLISRLNQIATRPIAAYGLVRGGRYSQLFSG